MLALLRVARAWIGLRGQWTAQVEGFVNNQRHVRPFEKEELI
jgi:hypothetical protein